MVFTVGSLRIGPSKTKQHLESDLHTQRQQQQKAVQHELPDSVVKVLLLTFLAALIARPVRFCQPSWVLFGAHVCSTLVWEVHGFSEAREAQCT